MLPDMLISVHRKSYERFVEKLSGGQFWQNLFPCEVDGLGYCLKNDERTITKVKVDFADTGNIVITPSSKSILQICRDKDLTYHSEIVLNLNLEFYGTDSDIPLFEGESLFSIDLPQMLPLDEGDTFLVNGNERAPLVQIRLAPGVSFEAKDSEYRALLKPQRGAWLDFRLNQKTKEIAVYKGKVAQERKFYITDLLQGLGKSEEDIRERFSDLLCYIEAPKNGDKEKKGTEKENEAVISKVHRILIGEKANLQPREALIADIQKFFEPPQYDLSPLGRQRLNRELGLDAQEGANYSGSLTASDIEAIFKRLVDFANGKVTRTDREGLHNMETRLIGDVLEEAFLSALNRAKRNFSSQLKLDGAPVRAEEAGKVTEVKEEIVVQTNDSGKKANKKKYTFRSGKQKPLVSRSKTLKKGDILAARYLEFDSTDSESIEEKFSKYVVGFLNSNIISQALESVVTSSLCQIVDDTNPIALLASKRRATMFGKGGLSSHRGFIELRDVHLTHYGRIDFVDTPQGKNIGMNLSLANHVGLKLGPFAQLTAPYYKVEGGKISDADLEWLSPDDEQAKQPTLAYSDQKENIAQNEQNENVKARVGTKEVETVSADSVDYIDAAQPLGVTASLIPFFQHNDVNRCLMACNAMKQAVPLLSPQAPLIKTGLEREYAEHLWLPVSIKRAKVAGTVKTVEDDGINILPENGKLEPHDLQLKPTHKKTIAGDIPTVTPGQPVEEGDIIAEPAGISNGEIALGRNVLVAFMPYFGWNYEDAIVVSADLVEQFRSKHIHEITVEVRRTDSGEEYRTKAELDFTHYTLEELERLADVDDEEKGEFVGVIKRGEEVKKGELLVGKKLPGKDTSVRSEISGKVVKVQRVRLTQGENERVAEKIRIRISYEKPLIVGSKLVNRHGGKGVVSRIVEPERMPYLEDGTRVDVILNPLGIISRMNIGQVFEAHLGWVAKKLDCSFIAAPFRGIDIGSLPAKEEIGAKVKGILAEGKSNAETIKQLLKLANEQPGVKLDDKGKSIIFAPYPDDEGKPEVEVEAVVGYMYLYKLYHHPDEKLNYRTYQGSRTQVMEQPFRGKGGGQKIGEMEIWALEGWNAGHILQEVLTFKSSDLHGRDEVMRFLRGISEEKPTSMLPEATKATFFYLRGLGLDVLMYDASGKSLDWASPESDIDVDNISKVQIKFTTDEEQKAFAKREAWEHPSEITTTEIFESGKQIYAKNGLFSEQIFGSIASHQCQCGDLRFPWEKGIFCPNCEVMVGSFFRRNRMGYIELACDQIINPLLSQQYEELERRREEQKNDKEMLETELEKQKSDGEKEKTLQNLIDKLKKDVRKKEAEIEEHKGERGNPKRREELKELSDRLRLWQLELRRKFFFIKYLPVISPDLRPRITIPSGRTINHDISQLYLWVLRANENYKKVASQKAPKEEELQKKRKYLQRAVNRLFMNGDLPRWEQATKKPNQQPLSGLLDQLSGKQGAFRGNLLGTRVDWSARAVIAVEPNLELHQCGIPWMVALSFFRNQVEEKIIENRIKAQEGKKLSMAEKRAIRIAVRQDIENRLREETISDEFFAQLERCLSENPTPILLNRQPSLHRLSIQAFLPVPTMNYTISLHPLACSGFNADFDGDQMACYLPITEDAKAEAQSMVDIRNYLFSPASGDLAISISQDIPLGIYYLTLMKDDGISLCEFETFDDAIDAHKQNLLPLHQKLNISKEPLMRGKPVQTTPGRILLYKIFPNDFGFDRVNKTLDKRELKALLTEYYHTYYPPKEKPQQFFAVFDQIKKLGFYYATMSGCTFSVFELPAIDEKAQFIADGKERISNLQQDLTEGERLEAVRKIWGQVNEQINHKLSAKLKEDRFNSFSLMIQSGARGDINQLSQLCCMRGLMSKLGGGIVEAPVTSSFLEGMSHADYLLSTHASRKSLGDKGLSPAKAGYLMRRMVEATHDVLITADDCQKNTEPSYAGLLISDIIVEESGRKRVLIPVEERLLGRNLAEKLPVAGKEYSALTEIDDEFCKTLLAENTVHWSEGGDMSLVGLILQQDVVCNNNETIPKGTVVDAQVEATLRAQGWENINLDSDIKSYYGRKIAYIHVEGKKNFIGQEFNAETAQSLKNEGVKEIGFKFSLRKPFKVKVRTPLTCQAKDGICQACYGKDLATNDTVSLGMPVGIIAAQSIGEPGTQLSMRTFHTGGKAGEADITQGIERVEAILEASDKIPFFKQKHGRQAVYNYLITELQSIYHGAKATINDKHFETLFRKMVQKIENGQATIWGLSRIARNSPSWLAASSFQETRRRLVERALRGETDKLQGLKENVILGRKI